MTDLYLAAAALYLFSAGLFVLGLKWAQRKRRQTVVLVAGFVIVSLGVYLFWLQDSAILASIFPFSSVIVLSNWLPPLAAFLGGMTWARMAGPARRRALLVVPLLVFSLHREHEIFLQSPPRTENKWKGDIALQTTQATCVAAAAATLLRYYGIPATEQEMARLALTRDEGTAIPGLYRGLKLKAQGTPYRVEAFTTDLQGLYERVQQGPVLLHVRLDLHTGVSRRYVTDWRWIPGQAHTVVLFRFLPDGRAEVGDPSVGREAWPLQALCDLWHGEGVRLVPPGAPEALGPISSGHASVPNEASRPAAPRRRATGSRPPRGRAPRPGPWT